VLPDLSALLGAQHYATFERHTTQARLAGVRGAPVQLQSAGLVLRSAGRMGRFSGFAYATALVPAGVDIHALLP
jgi:hypothetical protein